MKKPTMNKTWRTGLAVLTAAIGVPIAASAEELLSEKDALKHAFPEATAVSSQWTALTSNQMARIGRTIKGPQVPTVLQYHTATTNGDATGYAIVHTVAGKHGPIRLLVATTPELAVRRTEILAFRERRGQPVRDRSFLSQFAGKTLADGFALRSDIDGVTGATISSRAVAQGVREALVFLGVLTDQTEEHE